MLLEVYTDIVFLINFFIDVILIFLLKKVNKKDSSKLRIALAATVGGACAAVISIFPWMNIILRFTLMYVATSLLMIVIAFGKLKISDMIKQWIVLNLITYFVGGFMNSIYYHTNLRLFFINLGNGNIFSNASALYIIVSVCAVAVVSVFVLWLLRLYQIHRPLIYEVELVLGERSVLTKGLMDTGNCLYDPISKKPVMVIENSLIESLLTPNIRQDMEMARNYLEGKADDIPYLGYDDRLLRFSYIPYRSIGKTGMLLGIKLDKVLIHTEKENICNERVTVAICDNRLTDGKDDYHAILHKELL